jgi:alcohol dehydrogenase class IV
MPAGVAIASGVDVLAHAIEAYASVHSTPITDLWCEEALRIVGARLRSVAAGESGPEGRSAMSLAATMAGLAIARCRTTVCHSLGHAAGGLLGLVHGEVLACLMPAAFRYSMESRPEKYGRIAGLLSGEDRRRAAQGAPEDGLQQVRSLLADIGMVRGLGEIGVPGTRLAEIVDIALTTMKGALDADPAPVSREGLLGVLEEAL